MKNLHIFSFRLRFGPHCRFSYNIILVGRKMENEKFIEPVFLSTANIISSFQFISNGLRFFPERFLPENTHKSTRAIDFTISIELSIILYKYIHIM